MPDTLVLTGPTFQQVPMGSMQVTPTNGTTAALGAILGGTAPSGGTYGGLASVADGLTAHVGGTQAAALLLPAAINRVTTVTSATDSVKLPPSVAGMRITVINDASANALQIFGSGTDTIDAVATATGVALSAAKRAIFYCVTAGAWQSLTGVKAT